MRKLLIITGILMSISNSAVATTGATLTTQAKHILWGELNNEKVENAYHPEIQCLAENIYFEARAESYSGKAAVANVTKNRVADKRWPNTLCGVVMDGPVRESWKTKQTPDPDDAIFYPRKHRCQFSWYCDGKADTIWANKELTGQTIEGNARAWRESVQIAIIVSGHGSYTISDNTMGAVYYYAHNLVYPYWADKMEHLGILGNHTFMK